MPRRTRAATTVDQRGNRLSVIGVADFGMLRDSDGNELGVIGHVGL
jgi:hypothetical protein